MLNYTGMLWGSWKHFAAFPSAQSDSANFQLASCFRLEDFS